MAGGGSRHPRTYQRTITTFTNESSCYGWKWCGREDSNLHGIATASPSSWCVCQFRHFRKRRGEKNRARSFKASALSPSLLLLTSTASLELAPMEPAWSSPEQLEQESTSSELPVPLVPV